MQFQPVIEIQKECRRMADPAECTSFQLFKAYKNQRRIGCIMMMQKKTNYDILMMTGGISMDRDEKLVRQIEYLSQEYISIQSGFLAMIYVPMAFICVGVYYALEREELFLILPFLTLWCLYNIIKYTIKSLTIGGYIKCLEQVLNGSDMKENLFLWRGKVFGTPPFSLYGSVGQIPCIAALMIYLIGKASDTLLKLQTGVQQGEWIQLFYKLFWILLFVEIVFIGCGAVISALEYWRAQKSFKSAFHKTPMRQAKNSSAKKKKAGAK